MTDAQPSHGHAKSDKPRLLFIVTEAGYFASHKRDLARAAGDEDPRSAVTTKAQALFPSNLAVRHVRGVMHIRI